MMGVPIQMNKTNWILLAILLVQTGALVLWGGSGVILYILMWIIVPEEPVETPPPAPVSPPSPDEDEVPPAS